MNGCRSIRATLSWLALIPTAAWAAGLEVGGIALNPGTQDTVHVSQRKWTWGYVEKHPVISFTMKSNRYEFSLRHDSPGQPRIGIEAPTRSNWYQSGMIRLTLDGEPFVATSEAISTDEGAAGRASLAWDGAQGQLRYDFVLLPSDDRLYLQVTLKPTHEPKKIEIALSNYISGFNRTNPDHVLHTPVRTLAEPGSTRLDPVREHAIFYSDRSLDPADGRGDGPSAIAILPEGLVGLSTRAGGYGSGTTLQYRPGTKHMRFAFWEFPKWANRDALDYWRRSLPGAQAALAAAHTFALDGRRPQGPPRPLPALPAAAPSSDTEYRDNLFYDLSDDVATPHLTWAKPHASGPCRVLVVAPRWGQRETVELMQRFDVQCDVAMTMKHNLLAGRGYGSAQFMAVSEVARHFDRVLDKDVDVIVVAFFDWSQLLIEHRYQILKKVHDAGTGLVLVRPWKHDDLTQLFARGGHDGPDASLTAGIPWTALPLLDQPPTRTIRTGVFGKGRWAALHYKTGGTNHCLTPCRYSWQPEAHWEYEYYQSLLGKVIFWAGRKEAPVTIESMQVRRLDRARTPASVPVSIRSAVSAEGLSLRVGFHRLLPGQVVEGGRSALVLSPGVNRASVSIPCLRAGRYMANLQVLDAKDRVMTWSSFPFEVVHTCAVVQLELGRDAYDALEPIRGKVAMSRALAPGETLAIRWLDNHGRLLAERTERSGREWPLAHPGIQPLGTNVHRVQAVVSDSRGEATAAEFEFSVRGRPRPAFHLATWEEPQTDYLSHLWYGRLRDIGVDAIYYTIGRRDYVDAARLIARNDLFSAPMFVAYTAKSKPTALGPVHQNCLHDPDYQRAVDDRNREVAACWGRYDVLYYTDGSDKVMDGQCFAEPTLAAFRHSLKERYPGLKALNQAWGTSFASWDAVLPDTLKKAKGRNHFTSWVEHLRFMETAFLENDRRMNATLVAHDSDALMGHDGYGRLNSRDGADWWKLLHANTYYNLYTYQDPPQLEITRSIANLCPNVKQRSIYYGSYTEHFGNYPFLRRLPWYALLHDYTGLFWWVANGKVTYSTLTSYMVGPDFRCTKSYQVSREQIQAVNRGPAQLLAGARRMHSGVALYYDHASAVHAMTAFRHPRHMVTGCMAVQNLLEDLGLQYDYVVPQQIEDGRLHKAGYNVLVLTHILAMPKTTAKAVESFIREGGLVLANETPATHDSDLRPAAKGSLLAGLFGKPGQVCKTGSGSTVILPKPSSPYSRDRYTPDGAKARRQFLDFLRAAKLQRLAAAAPSGEDAGVPGLELVVYQSGAGHYIGALHSSPTPVSTTIKIPAPRHVYDLRDGKSLGLTAQWPLTLRDGATAFYAALPYAVGDITVEPAGRVATPGKPFAFAIDLHAEAGAAVSMPHAFLVDVCDPRGRAQPHYAHVLVSGDTGRATHAIPFALNDPRGTWTIRVTERLSGQTRETTVELR